MKIDVPDAVRGELGPWTADLSAWNHERPFDRLSERSIGVRKADRANGEKPYFRSNQTVLQPLKVLLK